MESEMYPVNSSSQDVNCRNLALFFFLEHLAHYLIKRQQKLIGQFKLNSLKSICFWGF